MKIIIQNRKTTPHVMCTVENFTRIIIPPNSYITLDTDNEREIDYWTNLKPSYLSSVGLAVGIDSIPIESNVVSDVSESDSTHNDKVTTDVKSAEFVEHESGYDEKSLSQMEKEDLFVICDNFGIKYKKNNSKQTLVKLILESGMV